MKKSGFVFLAAVAALGAISLRAEEVSSTSVVTPQFNLTAVPNAVGPLFNSNGFEAYTNGTLIGQGGFTHDAAATYTVGAGTGSGGGKGVTVTGNTTDWAYVNSAAYTPAANELVSTSADIAYNTGTTNTFGYLLDAYGNSARIGRVGLVINAGVVRAAVTTKINTTTGQPSASGTLGNYLVGGNLTAGTFYNFEMRFNFSLKTFDVYSGGSLLIGNCPFASTAGSDASFSDVDMQLSGTTGANSTGVFDNYAVSVLAAVPEPGTLTLMAGVGLAGVVLRRRR